jgi:Ala-tRNA(Pro) deacylase
MLNYFLDTVKRLVAGSQFIAAGLIKYIQMEITMEQYQIVYEALKKMGISYDLVEHPPALTTEEADSYIVGKEGVRTKTLFLCNRKRTAYFLVIMDDKKRLDMKKLSRILNEKGISFCSPEKLMEKMSLPPGVVSLFGLLNNPERDIKVYLDKEMLTEKFMSFHANDNTKTIFISTDDMFKFIEELGHEYSVVEL